MPGVSDHEPTPLYEELVGEWLIDPAKLLVELTTGLAECRDLLTNRLADGLKTSPQKTSKHGEY